MSQEPNNCVAFELVVQNLQYFICLVTRGANCLGTSSRIFRESPAFFVLSWNFALTYALFGYFWVDFGHFEANFEHFVPALISRFSVNGSDAYNYLQV